MTTSSSAILLRATLVGAVIGGAYARWLQPRNERWGATDSEVAVPLPGDEFVADPATQNTRAITIDAPPESVWPWLAQIGADRGGFYSYDALENLFRLDIHSADHIVDEWQDLQVGDVVYATRGRGGGWYVADVRPGSILVLRAADLARARPTRRTDRGGWEFVWIFALLDRGDGTTRLLVRERMAVGSTLTRLLMTPLGPVSFLMTRRMMLGIKDRCEAGGTQGPRSPITGEFRPYQGSLRGLRLEP
jgi:hypothetical protein